MSATESELRWAGQHLWQAADAFCEAVRQSSKMHPGMWPTDDLVAAMDGAVVAGMVAQRMGYKPAPTAPDSAPAP